MKGRLVNDAVKCTGGKAVVTRRVIGVFRSPIVVVPGLIVFAVSLVLLFAGAAPGFSDASANPNPNLDLQTFFRQDIGLTDDQIAAIRGGKPVAKALPSRAPAEVFLFAAVYINATPDAYFAFAHDVNQMRKLPYTEEVEPISNPPQLSDFKNFSFQDDDIQALKKCQPGDCAIQMPASNIEQLQRSIDWSASDPASQVNQLLQKTALAHVLEYQRGGNQVLGVYNDHRDPTVVAQQFAYMLSYVKVLPQRLPGFYNYLLSYPSAKPANVDNMFYWSRVKFGLKPTLRVVQMVSMRGRPGDEIAYAIAEKQLYSSHYFETALDMSFCVRDGNDSARPGFYLIAAMGSEQAGLTGAKGTIIRHVALGRSVSNLQDQLAQIKSTLEAGR
ncbi:MAG: hypothetical protein WA871_03235 [Candidatus Acidiferrales bacterium]